MPVFCGVVFSLFKRYNNDVLNYIIDLISIVIPFVIGGTENRFLIVIMRIQAVLAFYIFGYYFIRMIKMRDVPQFIRIFSMLLGAFIYFLYGNSYSFFSGYFLI